MELESVPSSGNIISGLLGLWLIISPFLLSYASTTAIRNSVLFGVIALAIAGIRLARPRVTWPNWLNALVGLWLIISPFVLGFSTGSALWNTLIVGIVLSLIALWNTPARVERTSGI